MGFRGWFSNVNSPWFEFGSVVYSSLYRYNARFEAIPDLADGPCSVPGADPLMVRCHLIETTFSDGTPLTADDVAYTFNLFGAPEQREGSGLANFDEARVVDPRTVDFALSSADASWAADIPGIPIFSRRDVEAIYAAFRAAAEGLTAEGVQGLAETIDKETEADPQVCSDARIGQADAFLARFGARLYREDYVDQKGFDPCGYLQGASAKISVVAEALGSTGPYAVFLALVFLDATPIGTGPYRLVSQDATGVHLEARPDYHGGAATTPHLDFVPANGDGSDLAAGTIDMLQGVDLGQTFESSAAANGLVVVNPPNPAAGFMLLTFNVRPGRLFADVNLRRALQLCIDLESDVDAATGGSGTPIYSPVLPGSWADVAGIPATRRDVAAARQLIEAAGWTPGADGVYAKDGVRLAAEILGRSSRPDRALMADLIAGQARDCGMDLRNRPLDDEAYMGVLVYPHDIPGAGVPFDLFLNGWALPWDPGGRLDLFVSSAIPDAVHTGAGEIRPNVGGFSDPEFDRLIAAGASTSVQDERVGVYTEAQELFADKVPAILLWIPAGGTDYVRSAVATTSGPLDRSAPLWAWQPERMIVAAGP